MNKWRMLLLPLGLAWDLAAVVLGVVAFFAVFVVLGILGWLAQHWLASVGQDPNSLYVWLGLAALIGWVVYRFRKW